jgi:hypothetical protein
LNLQNLQRQSIIGQGVTPLNQGQSNTVQNLSETFGPFRGQSGGQTTFEPVTSVIKDMGASLFDSALSFIPTVEASGPGDDEEEETVVTPTGSTATGSAVTSFLQRFNRPETPVIDDAEILRQAEARFRELFGADPNFDSMLADYTNTIRELSESGRVNLERAKELADERFGIAAERAQRGFREGQRTISEQAFLGQREQQQSLIERGLGGSGLAQLGVLQQRIAVGDAVSNMYRNFLDTVQNLGLAEADSELNFATAIQQLNQATEMQILQEKQRLDGLRMNYNTQRGQTIQSLSEAARNNRIQDFQLALGDWEGGLQIAALLDQETRDSVSQEISLIENSTEVLIASIQAGPGSQRDKDRKIEEARRNALNKINEATASAGLTSSDVVSSIFGSVESPNPRWWENFGQNFRVSSGGF